MSEGFNHIDKAIQFLRDSAYKSMEEVSIQVENSAVLNAPSDTGKLRQSMDHKVIQKGGETNGYVGTNQEYAVFVEMGTGEFAKNGDGRKGGWVYKAPNGKVYFTYGQKPQPFLEPAFVDNIDDIKKVIQEKFRG